MDATRNTLVEIANILQDDGAVVCWKLMPVSAAGRAALRLLNHHVDTVLNPAVFTFLMNKDPEQDATLKEALENALEILQEPLVSSSSSSSSSGGGGGGGGPFLMGRDFSLADIHVLPFILRMMIALKHYKNGYEVLSPTTSRFQPLFDWYQLCSKRASVRTVSKTKDEIVEVYDKFMDMNYNFGGLNTNKSAKT
jgi:glutathione S-transferase